MIQAEYWLVSFVVSVGPPQTKLKKPCLGARFNHQRYEPHPKMHTKEKESEALQGGPRADRYTWSEITPIK